MKKTLLFIVLGLFAFVALFKAHQLNAQGVVGQNLTVFPAIQDKQVKPGEQTRVQIQFKNGGTDTLSGALRVVDFVVADKQGTPKVIEDAKLVSKYGASSWITLPSTSLSIPPRDYVSVDLGVVVPDDISTCAKYALVYFEPSNLQLNAQTGQQTQSSTQVSSRLGGIITFNVENSNCKENMTIAGFTVPQFQEFGPVVAKFDLYNLSDYHITPIGYGSLTNFLGMTVDQQMLKQQRIFPEAAKPYELSFGSKWMLGRYKVSVTASSNGPKSVTRDQEAYIWVIPWKIGLVVILSIIVAVLLIKNFYKKVTKHEAVLESEIAKEKKEIEQLKEQLRKKNE